MRSWRAAWIMLDTKEATSMKSVLGCQPLAGFRYRPRNARLTKLVQHDNSNSFAIEFRFRSMEKGFVLSEGAKPECGAALTLAFPRSAVRFCALSVNSSGRTHLL
jgi:hypothetical protein